MKIEKYLPIIVAAIVFVAVVITSLSVLSMGYPAGYGSAFLFVMTVVAIAATVSFMSYILAWGILKLLNNNNNNVV